MLALRYYSFFCHLSFFFFFFFKQKTAYEMRISDWSSDVCSSDLGSRTPIRRPAPMLGEHTTQVLTEIGMSEEDIEDLVGRNVVSEIGRASCRERVGQ